MIRKKRTKKAPAKQKVKKPSKPKKTALTLVHEALAALRSSMNPTPGAMASLTDMEDDEDFEPQDIELTDDSAGPDQPEEKRPRRKANNPRERYLLLQVKFLYDIQRFRIAMNNRVCAIDAAPGTPNDDPDIELLRAYLSPQAKAELRLMTATFAALEERSTSLVAEALKGIPIWEQWLKNQKGVGPKMGGFLVSETNIERCNTVSQLWSWYGLGLKENGDGSMGIQRLVKGQKATFSPERKAKVLEVLGGCLLKAKSQPSRDLYDHYRHRKTSERVPVCLGCGGHGHYQIKVKAADGTITHKDGDVCENCKGTGGPAPWGRGEAHRHRAALRYMVKQFLLNFWQQWRTLEGLPCPAPYEEVYLSGSHPGPSKAVLHKFGTPGGACPHCGTTIVPEGIKPRDYILVQHTAQLDVCLAPSCFKCQKPLTELMAAS